jgi:hypothetical protein
MNSKWVKDLTISAETVKTTRTEWEKLPVALLFFSHVSLAYTHAAISNTSNKANKQHFIHFTT